ncbi:unnamed protein product [Blepharisma stoltei]|uniref:NEDD8-activating enzyme E1 regulatory subunit n=1 Tax=Blepharisma stoltei TaxID=1481888 RepID=A0AAU9IYP7_9CILI|nr:unnamed protein product [Blepharisma stoltei]
MATDNKYDRQLRLWGSHGQKALNTSKICLLKSSSLGTEILKNLVLPGIGHFTIIDNQIVSERDFGNNFFLTRADLGRPRAEATKEWLLELNPDVNGESLQADPSELIRTNPEYFSQFTLIISTQLRFADDLALSRICEQKNITFLIAKSLGFINYLRVYKKEHLVVEGKPTEKDFFDLRIHKPFQELKIYADLINVDELNDMKHKHTPYIILLMKYLEEWKNLHGDVPKTFEEKDDFKKLIKSHSRDFYGEENFREAVNNAYLAYLDEDLPFSVTEILNDPKSLDANSDSDNFWKCSKAVKQFIDESGSPPVMGIFPDMTSDTDSYIALQRIYQNKASTDLEVIKSKVSAIKGSDLDQADVDFITLFCKNLQMIEVSRFKSIETEFKELNVGEIMSAMYEDLPVVDWYWGIRACDKFIEENGRYPGSEESKDSEDKAQLLRIANQLIAESGVEGVEFKPEIAGEIVRFGDCELHSIAAILGGIASQEAIKLITHQYTPINNTYIYSAITSSSQVIEV